jgi:hypothetical protein
MPTPTPVLLDHVRMSPADVWHLSILATAGLAVMWIVFWAAVSLKRESITEILMNPAFFRTVAVMGVVAATVVLSLADRLEGNLTAAILSGIVGYVLGAMTKSKGNSNLE